MKIETFLYLTNGLSLGIYLDPSSKDDKPYFIRLIGNDKEPFRHGIGLLEGFKTKELAHQRRLEIVEYFDWKILEENKS